MAACGVLAALQVASAVVVMLYIRRLLPSLYPWWQSGDWRFGLQGLRKSIPLTLVALIQQGAVGGIVILVSFLFTSAAVPAFTTLRTVTNTTASVTGILIAAILPDLVRLHVTGQTRKTAEILDGNWFLSGAIVNVATLAAIPVVESLYGWWTRGN